MLYDNLISTEKYTLHKPTIVKERFTNISRWSIDGNFIELRHNTITGVRSIFVNGFLHLSTKFKWIDNGSVHPIDINNNTYSIYIIADTTSFRYELRRVINIEI